jgi:hypothetical protein
MSEIQPAANLISTPEISSGALSPSASPDPAFSRIMGEAMKSPSSHESSSSPTTISFNANNLLNGQFPPPDSGAGYTFTTVSLMGEEAA